MERIVDLRSDTTTRPSPGMRAAMAEAVVGDDVFDDDPTVHALQARAASLLGKADALFMPSGTMSNVVAIKVQTTPGDEVLLDSNAHSMLYEAGNAASVANVITRQFRSTGGVPSVDDIAAMVHKETLHSPRTALILLENSHNRAGGAVIPLEVHRAIHRLADQVGMAVHLDGARLFNAATSLGISAALLAECADTVTFCLSKGLGCPVGSVLCGTVAFIARARRVRKMLGGGMRQAGILAAAGLYALDHNILRLAVDHEHAQRLAAALSGADGLTVETESPATNMVYIRTCAPAEVIVGRLRQRYGVRLIAMGSHVLRAVTHLDVDAAGVDHAATSIRAVCPEQYTA